MTNQFLNMYLQRGWGSMNKNDFEVYIFYCILQTDEYRCLNDYELSLKLRVPQTKIKRLRYEAGLQYSQPEFSVYNAQFLELLKEAKPQMKDNKYVEFIMENKGLYLYIDNLLKKDGRFGDRSFNSEMMVISMDNLVYLLETTILSEQEKEALLSTFKRTMKDTNLHTALLEIVKAFACGLGKGITGGADHAGVVLWDFAVTNIQKVIQWIPTLHKLSSK